MEVALGVIVVVAFFALIAVGSSVRVLREYERGVIFRLGRLIAQKGPGLILLIPFIDRMVKVDLRTVTLNIPPQEVITRDNVPAGVNAVAYFRVIDPNKAIVEVENFLLATSQISQTALRSVLGKAELDQLLSERERLNEELQKIIDESTEPWGVKVTAVEIKDVEIPEQMQRAMARQAEAERERRAKIINSEGEFQAAQKLTDAADIISTNPASLQLRYLQTLLEIGSNQNTTVVFPLPMDVLEPFIGTGSAEHKTGGSKAQAADAAGPAAPPPATSPTPTTSPPRGPERARDPHRPAERAEDDPRPRPRRAPGQFSAHGGASRRAPESCPFCEGREDRTPPEVYALRPGGGEPDSPGWTTRVVPNLYPALGGHARSEAPAAVQRTARRRAGAEAGAFASSGDPLLASRRAGEPDLFSSRPASGAHEVIDQRAPARDRDGRARRGAVRRRGRHLARADARPRRRLLRAADRQRGRRRRRLARAHPRPALRAALRAGRGRPRARAGRRLRRTHRRRRPARRRPGRGGAPPRAPGRDRRRGGADLPLGLALPLRAAGDPAPRVAPASRRTRPARR